MCSPLYPVLPAPAVCERSCRSTDTMACPTSQSLLAQLSSNWTNSQILMNQYYIYNKIKQIFMYSCSVRCFILQTYGFLLDFIWCITKDVGIKQLFSLPSRIKSLQMRMRWLDNRPPTPDLIAAFYYYYYLDQSGIEEYLFRFRFFRICILYTINQIFVIKKILNYN